MVAGIACNAADPAAGCTAAVASGRGNAALPEAALLAKAASPGGGSSGLVTAELRILSMRRGGCAAPSGTALAAAVGGLLLPGTACGTLVGAGAAVAAAFVVVGMEDAFGGLVAVLLLLSKATALLDGCSGTEAGRAAGGGVTVADSVRAKAVAARRAPAAADCATATAAWRRAAIAASVGSSIGAASFSGEFAVLPAPKPGILANCGHSAGCSRRGTTTQMAAATYSPRCVLEEQLQQVDEVS